MGGGGGGLSGGGVPARIIVSPLETSVVVLKLLWAIPCDFQTSRRWAVTAAVPRTALGKSDSWNNWSRNDIMHTATDYVLWAPDICWTVLKWKENDVLWGKKKKRRTVPWRSVWRNERMRRFGADEGSWRSDYDIRHGTRWSGKGHMVTRLRLFVSHLKFV